MSRHDDRRVQYTKMFLRNALLELMKEKPIGKITPTELCRKANINRNTFYSHFSCVEELMQSIENELSEQMLRHINTFTSANDILSFLTGICQVIQDNADLFRTFLSDNGDPDYLPRMLAHVHDKAINDWRSRGFHFDDQDMELFFSFVSHGSVAVIRDWLSGGMKKTPEELALFIQTITAFDSRLFAH